MGYTEVDDNVSLARKARPTSLKGYIGNEDLKETVLSYLKNKRPQSALFSGHSGCGKTTLSRIFAKEYCCEDWSPETGACGVCQSCMLYDEYIKTGNSEALPDLYEIDSAENSGKKDIDVLFSSMEYPAVAGDWKIHIIDEAHLLSQGAMGRLLKTLEEPVEGVLIILCTTDPEKLLDTVKNRCQLKLQVSKPKTTEIMALLRKICEEEGKIYDLSGLRTIVSRSDNVVRDALNNLERVLSTKGEATGVKVSEEFKQASDKLVLDFFKAYFEEDYAEYLNIMYTIKVNYGFKDFIQSLTNLVVRGIYVLNSVDVEGLSKEEIDTYMSLFSKFSMSEISYILAELRRMQEGNVEANLMSFIYLRSQSKISQIEIKKETLPEDSAEFEVKIRNNNLERIQTARLEKGIESINSEMEEVTLDDMSEFFSLEKVE